ncbi:MAG: type II secretion system F family protein [Clostridiaceae bacterium]|nr:type II secretion system F family protein [Clostridiaceae bacterium]
MLVLFFVTLLAVSIFLLLSSGKYDELVKCVDEKQNKLIRMLLPVGFYIMDMIGYKYTTRYDKLCLAKLTEIHGAKRARLYLKIHWAGKIAVLILGILTVSLTGMGMEMGPNRVASGGEGGKGSGDIAFIIFGVLLIASMAFLHDKELEKRLKKRRLSISIDFPGFLNKMTLLVNAGLTVRKAWEKIAQESPSDSDFYKEVNAVIGEINAGKPELKAYEDFARRCRTAEVARFVTILLQNIRKGNEEMVSILRVLSNESWDTRKNIARKLGEEASTKMIVPLMLMFIAILIIVAAPAIMAISGL